MNLRIEESELARAPRLRAAVEDAERKGRARRAPAPPPAGKRARRGEDKAAAFGAYWRMDPATHALPAPVAEHRFAPPRRWRFDWAWPALLLAVEVDGGRWSPGGGKHGSDEDRTKLNHAAAMGWRVFRFSPAQLKREAPACVAMVVEAVRGGGA